MDNPTAAEGVMKDIDDALAVLARFPKAGPARPELFWGVRTFPAGVYLVIYQIKEDEVLVLRVLHGASDLPRILKLTVD